MPKLKKRKRTRQVAAKVDFAPVPVARHQTQNTVGGLEADLTDARHALGLCEAEARQAKVALGLAEANLAIASAGEAVAEEALRHGTARLLLGEVV